MVSFARLLFLLCSDLRQALGCEWGKYGDTCEQSCPQECAVNEYRQVRHCHRETGRCSEGCVAGWYGDLCDQPCSKTCLLRVCNQQNGQCTLGCSENTLGDFCEISSASAEPDHNVNVDSRPWFILFVVCVVVICGCGVTQILILVCRQREWRINRKSDTETRRTRDIVVQPDNYVEVRETSCNMATDVLLGEQISPS